MSCPFCKRDPFHYVDNGIGYEPVAIVCCDLGIALWANDKTAKQILRFRRSHSPRKKARAQRLLRKMEE